MADKKHILFISSWYPNRNDPTHGIFNTYFAQAASLYNNISVLNVSSELNPDQGLELKESEDKGVFRISVYYKKVMSRIPVVSQWIKRKRVLTAFDEGYRRLVEKRGKPDLIHLNVVLPMGIAALHLSEQHNIPMVINENWSGYTAEDGNYRGFLQKYFTHLIVKKAKALMPTSTYLRDAMLSHGIKGNYTVVPNVVDVNVFKPMEVAGHTGTRLIHVSSLNDREKNVSGLLRGFAKACEKEKELQLIIVGEGVDKKKYESLVRELKIENRVVFKGRIFSNELVEEINKSDALIMFSNFETFCLVIIESFACGKPVITSDAGAIKTYMKPELGIVVNKGKEEDLAVAITQYAKNKSSFNSGAIRQFAVDNYSYEVVGKSLDRIYNQALEGHK